jgi:hypothetical protein
MEKPTTSLYETIKNRRPLFLVHDGGAAPPLGSFGWVLANADEILWTGLGTARGNPMQSFRAEGYGRLSGVCFLGHFMKFFEIPNDQCGELHFHTDSKSLLDRYKA